MSFSVLETRVVRNQSRLIFKSLGKCCPGKQFINTCVIIYRIRRLLIIESI